jgi:hypothetical protein
MGDGGGGGGGWGVGVQACHYRNRDRKPPANTAKSSNVHDHGPFAKECGLGERSDFEVGVGGSGDGEAGRASSH